MNRSAAEIVREYGPFPGIDHVHGVGPPALPVETLAKLRDQIVGRFQAFDSMRFDRAPQQCLGAGKPCIMDPCCRERDQQVHGWRTVVIVRGTVRGLFPRALRLEHTAAAGTCGGQCSPYRRACGVTPSLESSRLASQCPARPCATATSFIDGRSRENPRDTGICKSPQICLAVVQRALVHRGLRQKVPGLGAALDNHRPSRAFRRDRRQHFNEAGRAPFPDDVQDYPHARARRSDRDEEGGQSRRGIGVPPKRLARHEQGVIAQPAQPRLRAVLEANRCPKQV